MNSHSSSSSKRATFLRVSGTLLALALLVYLFRQQGWAEIGQAIQNITLWQLIVALGLMVLSRFAVCGRWHVLLRSAGLPISLLQTIRLTFAGLFASNFLPTTIGGDVVRLAGAIQLHYDTAISTASLIVDRLVGMAGMLMALPFGLSGLDRLFPPAGFKPQELLLSGFLPATWRLRASLILDKARGLLDHFVGRLLQAIAAWIHQPRALLLALLFSWIHMLCLFGSIAVLLHGMGETISYWQIAGLWSAVYFVTLLPVSINGYGLQELSMAFFFSGLGGISQAGGLTIALLIRTLMMVASLPGAVAVPEIMAGRTSR